MKFGILFANLGVGGSPEGATALAQLAEQCGFESIWTVEHPVVPVGYQSKYPYSKSGKMPGPEGASIPDPLIWMTWVAATTQSIRVGTAIMILPLRNPAVLAKELATLDMQCGGRVTLGIGTGWLKEEFEALGIPWERRGARTDEYVAAMRALWGPGAATYHGEFTNFTEVHSSPKPVQPGGIPILVGGATDAGARRAGRIGDDYFPGVEPGRLAQLTKVMHEAAIEAGRNPDDIGITTGGLGESEELKVLADMGVTRFVLPAAWATIEEAKRSLGAFSEKVIATY